MVEGIAISVAGLQNASAKADKAAKAIASPDLPVGTPEDVVDIESGGGAAVATAGEVAQGSLEANLVALKTATLMYKANAEALRVQLDAQKEAFEQLI